MKVLIQSEITHDPKLHTAVDQANEFLKEELEQSTDQVTADWTLGTDEHDRQYVHLALSDFTGTVEDRFFLEDFEDSERLRFRLHRLWGDLLQVGSRKLINQLMEMARELEN